MACPTWVVGGASDEMCLGVSQAMAYTIMGADVVVIEDAGQSPQFENGAVWLDALREFLAALDARSTAA